MAQIDILMELNFLMQLRNTSYRSVNLLDHLVHLVPDGISLNKIIRIDKLVTIFGKSASDVQVTLFMKNIAKSKVLTQPVLTEFTAKENKSDTGTYFQLLTEQRG